MKVQKNPFKIEFNVYNDGGTLLGTQTIAITGFSYAEINYICPPTMEHRANQFMTLTG